ncbi:MAG: TatD family hydrolase [bacterium]
MRLVDTHTHLYLEQFKEDRQKVVQRALEQGVEIMLLPNIDADSLQDMQEFHREFPDHSLTMMGLHPTSVKEDFETQLALVEQELSSGNYCAVGEIGMDLYWDKSYLEHQRIAFRHQLKLAKTHKLPVSIHTREAFDEIYAIVKEELTDELKGVFHCFTGTPEQAEKIIQLGFSLGIGGVLTFKNAKLGDTLSGVPLKNLVLETDAPFLAPVPYRGKRNESSYLRIIAEKLAEVKRVRLEKVAETTTQTAAEIYQLTNS